MFGWVVFAVICGFGVGYLTRWWITWKRVCGALERQEITVNTVFRP